MWGCGSGGGSADKAAPVSLIVLHPGEYIIQGNNIDNVATMELTLSYTSQSGPFVRLLGLASGATMTNTLAPGTIKISIASSRPLSGSGQIAEISFDSGSLSSTFTLDSVIMLDPNGNTIQ